MGRPSLEINEDLVYELASEGATNTEIAEKFDCDESTIRKRFGPALRQARAEFKHTIRKQLYQRMQASSDRVLILMAQHYLGMTSEPQEPEKPEAEKQDLSKLTVEDLKTLRGIIAKTNPPKVQDVAPVAMPN